MDLEDVGVSVHLDRAKAALSDRYTIEREIGSGGMATAYLAHDIRHERSVVVRVLPCWPRMNAETGDLMRMVGGW